MMVAAPTPRDILVIDPGNRTGWAIYRMGLLMGAGVTSPDGVEWPGLLSSGVGAVVIELPQVYRASQSKGDPNDLIKVAVGVGRWVERAVWYKLPYELVLPNTWKGQVPKPIHHGRALACLEVAEQVRLPGCSKTKENPHGYDNNMLDAVALGLWKLGRLRR